MEFIGWILAYLMLVVPLAILVGEAIDLGDDHD